MKLCFVLVLAMVKVDAATPSQINIKQKCARKCTEINGNGVIDKNRQHIIKRRHEESDSFLQDSEKGRFDDSLNIMAKLRRARDTVTYNTEDNGDEDDDDDDGDGGDDQDDDADNSDYNGADVRGVGLPVMTGGNNLEGMGSDYRPQMNQMLKQNYLQRTAMQNQIGVSLPETAYAPSPPQVRTPFRKPIYSPQPMMQTAVNPFYRPMQQVGVHQQQRQQSQVMPNGLPLSGMENTGVARMMHVNHFNNQPYQENSSPDAPTQENDDDDDDEDDKEEKEELDPVMQAEVNKWQESLDPMVSKIYQESSMENNIRNSLSNPAKYLPQTVKGGNKNFGIRAGSALIKRVNHPVHHMRKAETSDMSIDFTEPTTPQFINSKHAEKGLELDELLNEKPTTPQFMNSKHVDKELDELLNETPKKTSMPSRKTNVNDVGGGFAETLYNKLMAEDENIISKANGEEIELPSKKHVLDRAKKLNTRKVEDDDNLNLVNVLNYITPNNDAKVDTKVDTKEDTKISQAQRSIPTDSSASNVPLSTIDEWSHGDVGVHTKDVSVTSDSNKVAAKMPDPVPPISSQNKAQTVDKTVNKINASDNAVKTPESNSTTSKQTPDSTKQAAAEPSQSNVVASNMTDVTKKGQSKGFTLVGNKGDESVVVAITITKPGNHSNTSTSGLSSTDNKAIGSVISSMIDEAASNDERDVLHPTPTSNTDIRHPASREPSSEKVENATEKHANVSGERVLDNNQTKKTVSVDDNDDYTASKCLNSKSCRKKVLSKFIDSTTTENGISPTDNKAKSAHQKHDMNRHETDSSTHYSNPRGHEKTHESQESNDESRDSHESHKENSDTDVNENDRVAHEHSAHESDSTTNSHEQEKTHESHEPRESHESHEEISDVDTKEDDGVARAHSAHESDSTESSHEQEKPEESHESHESDSTANDDASVDNKEKTYIKESKSNDGDSAKIPEKSKPEDTLKMQKGGTSKRIQQNVMVDKLIHKNLQRIEEILMKYHGFKKKYQQTFDDDTSRRRITKSHLPKYLKMLSQKWWRLLGKQGRL